MSETASHQGPAPVHDQDWIHLPPHHLTAVQHHSPALLSLVDDPLAGHVHAPLDDTVLAVDLLAMDMREVAVHGVLDLPCLIVAVTLAPEITLSHPSVLECLV